MKFVGLDVGKNWIFVCILNAQGKVVKEFKVKIDGEGIHEQLRRLRSPLAVCYEASCGYGHLYDGLARYARRIVVAHPGQLRLIFKSKRKNDRVDAKKLAMLLFLDQVPAIHVPSIDVRAWRSLIEFRNRLVAKRTRVKNGLRAVCRTHGIQLPRGKTLWSRRGLALLAKQDFPHRTAALERDLLMDELGHACERIKRIEAELDDIARHHAGVALLQTIPGVGPRTAEAFAAYVDRPQRFGNVKQVAAYFGLVPCQDQSGHANRLGHITREGPSTMRRLLTEASWQGVKNSPQIRARYEQIQRGDPQRRKIALVAIGHYLVRVMFAMLRRGEAWNEAGGPYAATAA